MLTNDRVIDQLKALSEKYGMMYGDLDVIDHAIEALHRADIMQSVPEPTSNLVCADCNGTGWFNEGEKVACEECVTGEQRYFEVNGHYPGCGVYEGTQRGPCSCNAQNRPAEPT